MIQLVNAFLAEQAGHDEDGRLVVVPIELYRFPVELRDQMKREGAGYISIPVNDLIAWVTLFGGRGGEEFTLSWQFVYPIPDWNADIPTELQHFVWPEGDLTFHAVIHITTQVPFLESGIYKLKFLLNGVPLTTLGWPIVWADFVIPGA